jgi:hypothetical protein
MEEIKEVVDNRVPSRAFKKLFSEKDRPTRTEALQAITTDLRERQYWAYLKSGSSEAEARALSGWAPPK